MGFYQNYKYEALWLNRYSYLYENLNEGLIKSYDIRDVKKYLEKEENFNCISNVSILDRNIYFSRRKQFSSDEFINISLKTDPFSISQYNDVVNACYRLLGWFVGGIQVDVRRNNGNGYASYIFFRGEPYKKDKEVRDIFYCEDFDIELKNFISLYINKICGFSLIIEEKYPIKQYMYSDSDVFYHLTDKKHLEKILKNGLVPKSKFNYPSRIYLTNNIENLDDFEINITNPVILKIRLNRNEKLYVDPRCEGFFTYDNISHKEIQIYK